MHFDAEALFLLVAFLHFLDGFLSKIIGYEKFLKVELVHLLSDDASDGDGGGGAQSDAQETATCDKSVAIVLSEKFEHSEILRILLYLVYVQYKLGPHIYTFQYKMWSVIYTFQYKIGVK